mmetsp:Transcript_12949/g.22203  ORF Transcript_12949/g.22203 Transcript_12949/m.22203 type:complete len:435 (-) Transcript_12949:908-2212(-)
MATTEESSEAIPSTLTSSASSSSNPAPISSPLQRSLLFNKRVQKHPNLIIALLTRYSVVIGCVILTIWLLLMKARLRHCQLGSARVWSIQDFPTDLYDMVKSPVAQFLTSYGFGDQEGGWALGKISRRQRKLEKRMLHMECPCSSQDLSCDCDWLYLIRKYATIALRETLNDPKANKKLLTEMLLFDQCKESSTTAAVVRGYRCVVMSGRFALLVRATLQASGSKSQILIIGDPTQSLSRIVAMHMRKYPEAVLHVIPGSTVGFVPPKRTIFGAKQAAFQEVLNAPVEKMLLPGKTLHVWHNISAIDKLDSLTSESLNMIFVKNIPQGTNLQHLFTLMYSKLKPGGSMGVLVIKRTDHGEVTSIEKVDAWFEFLEAVSNANLETLGKREIIPVHFFSSMNSANYLSFIQKPRFSDSGTPEVLTYDEGREEGSFV